MRNCLFTHFSHVAAFEMNKIDLIVEAYGAKESFSADCQLKCNAN